MNLYQIQQELTEIVQTIEEQGGEFTDEQLQQLICSKESFKDKVLDYYHVISNYNNDIDICKSEEGRIKELRKSREKIVDKLKGIIVDAIVNFGDINKNGVNYIEYPTLKLSTRNSSSVEVDEKRADEFKIKFLQAIANELKTENDIDNILYESGFNENDIRCGSINFNFNISCVDLLMYKTLRSNIATLFDIVSMEAKYIPDKQIVKDMEENNQHTTLCTVRHNKTLQIK